jgi:hypothetical protein
MRSESHPMSLRWVAPPDRRLWEPNRDKSYPAASRWSPTAASRTAATTSHARTCRPSLEKILLSGVPSGRLRGGIPLLDGKRVENESLKLAFFTAPVGCVVVHNFGCFAREPEIYTLVTNLRMKQLIQRNHGVVEFSRRTKPCQNL